MLPQVWRTMIKLAIHQPTYQAMIKCDRILTIFFNSFIRGVMTGSSAPVAIKLTEDSWRHWTRLIELQPQDDHCQMTDQSERSGWGGENSSANLFFFFLTTTCILPQFVLEFNGVNVELVCEWYVFFYQRERVSQREVIECDMLSRRR